MSASSMQGMSDMGMAGQQGAMTAYLHFTPLMDTLWFQYWVPTSPAAVLGSCIGLFLLAIFDKWIAAVRSVAEKAWNESAQLEILANHVRQSKQQLPRSSEKSEPPVHRYNIPPLIPSLDISRGILHAIQIALSYFLMLAAMTFQAGFIISICLGEGVGEMMFGRYITSDSSHH